MRITNMNLAGALFLALACSQGGHAQSAGAPYEPKARAGTAYLGVDIHDITPERAASLQLKENRGVEITMVDDDSPAFKAGLKEHDVIQSFNGQSVENVEQLRRLIHQTQPGREVTLGVMRGGQMIQLKATLGKHMTSPVGNYALHMPPINIPPLNLDIPGFSVVQFWRRNGLEVEDLSPQLAEFLGVPNAEGVLVRSVEPNTPGAEAGLKAGDVVVKAEGETIGCGTDWRHAMSSHSGGTINLGIIRDRHEQSIVLKLPEQKSSGGNDWDSPELQKELDELKNLGPAIQKSFGQDWNKASQELQHSMEELERELRGGEREYEHEMQQWKQKGVDREKVKREQLRLQQELKRQLAEAQRAQQTAQEETRQEAIKEALQQENLQAEAQREAQRQADEAQRAAQEMAREAQEQGRQEQAEAQRAVDHAQRDAQSDSQRSK